MLLYRTLNQDVHFASMHDRISKIKNIFEAFFFFSYLTLHFILENPIGLFMLPGLS